MTETILILDTPSDLKIEHSRCGNRVIFSADNSNILDHFDAAQVVAHFGSQALFDELGEQAARDFWGFQP